ncbi:MAG TPA: hypothetical protein VET88_01910, partial [Gammaproteobacteria bacterium]|nr:hypothetical protein [Gammaproteobacteria bacterium]
MQFINLKRPRFFIPASIVLVLAITATVVFHPGFQKKMLLDHVGPLLDSLQIEHVHLTPWSLELSDVVIDYAGGHFRIGKASLRFCLSSLLLLQLNIKQFLLQDVLIDVAEFHPPPSEPVDESGIFPGVLAVLEHGLGYRLQELDVATEVILPGQQSLLANVTGGDIRPDGKGAIQLDVRFNTGKGEDHILVNGTLALDQLSRGRFAAIETGFDIQAALTELPQNEHLNINLAVTPAVLDKEQLAIIEGGEVPYAQETVQLRVQQNDTEGNNRAVLDLAGTYDGNAGDFNGSYRVTANERLIQPYLRDKVMPPTEEVLKGAIDFNIADLTGDVTVISDLLVTDLREASASHKVPELLTLKNNFRLSLLPGRQLRIFTLDAGLSDEGENQPLAASLPADLHIPLDDIGGFLQQENTLLEFEIPGVPLAWFDVFLPEQEITGGRLTGAFRITTDTSSSIHLKPSRPLEITGLTILQGDAVLLDRLNISILPEASYTADAVQVKLGRIAFSATEGTLATGTVTASLPLAGERQGGVDARATADLNVYNLLAFLDIKKSGRFGVPRHFSVDFHTALQPQTDRVVISN